MNVTTWYSFDSKEQISYCQKLDIGKEWAFLKEIERLFVREFCDEKLIVGAFCAYAKNNAPQIAINVYLAEGMDASIFPEFFLGFPVLCLYEPATSNDLKPSDTKEAYTAKLLKEFECYENGMSKDADFDDEIWCLLGKVIPEYDDGKFQTVPEAVQFYYASRNLQWSVGFDGFYDAATRSSVMLHFAHKAYLAFKLDDSVALIKRAMELVRLENDADDDYLDEQWSSLDKSLENSSFFLADLPRIDYIVKNKQMFVNYFNQLPCRIFGQTN